MLQYVTDDERQVILSDYFLSVSKFRYSFCHLLRLLRRQFESQFLKVSRYICFSTVFAKCIFTFASKTLRYKVIAVKVVLVVTVCMHSRNLCKHIVANDGLVWSYGNARITLNHTANVVELAFVDTCLCVKLVLQDYLHTRQRRIATSFAKTVNRDV